MVRPGARLFPGTPAAALGAVCALLWTMSAAAQPVALRYAAPPGAVEYDLRVNLTGTLRAAPVEAGDHPYTGTARLKGEGSARVTVRGAQQGEELALAVFLSSAHGLLEAFDSRFEANLVSGADGARITIAVNDTEVANEVVGSALGLGPLALTMGPHGPTPARAAAGGPAPGRDVVRALTAIASLLTRLPESEMSAGDETEYALPQADAPLTGSVGVRLVRVDAAAGTEGAQVKSALLELRGLVAPAARTFRLRLPGPETGPPLWFGVEIERWECETTGRLTMPVGGGLPAAASGEMVLGVDARLGADAPDWQGRAVRVRGDLRLTYDLRRHEH